jgi:hypothetical protein
MVTEHVPHVMVQERQVIGVLVVERISVDFYRAVFPSHWSSIEIKTRD